MAPKGWGGDGKEATRAARNYALELGVDGGHATTGSLRTIERVEERLREIHEGETWAIEGQDGKDYSHDSHHNVSHINLPYEQAFIGSSVVVTMNCFATLLEQLMATPEGDGNLLDHSCILMSSGVAEGWSHSEVDYPLIVAGHAGGGLKKDVGHFRSPNEESMSNIGLACIQAVAPEAGITEHGSDEGSYKGRTTTPCSAILA